MKKEILINGSNVTVLFRKGDKYAETIIDEVRKGYRKAGKFLNQQLEGDITIHLVYSRKEYDSIFDRKTENWLVATAQKEKNKITMFSPLVVEKYSNNHTKESLTKIIHHEIAHLFIGQEGFVPWWLNEGLAYVIAGQTAGYEKEKLKKLLHSGKMFVYSEENYRYVTNNGGYSTAKYITDNLLKDFGKEKIIDLINVGCSEKDFNSVFKKKVGISAMDYARKLIV